MKMMNKIEKLREILDGYEEKLDDLRDDTKMDVKDAIRDELECMSDDEDLLDFVNDNCGGDVHLMEERAFNDYMDNEGYSCWDVLDMSSDFDTSDTYFGVSSDGCLKSSCDLSDFVELDDVVTELIDNDEDLGNSEIRDALDRLNNLDEEEKELEHELVDELMEVFEVEAVKTKEPKQDNELEKVIDWIYEHKMLGEDFDNKFPNLADKYKEKEC